MLSGLIKREWQRFRADPWMLALLSYIPVISVLMLWWLFSAATPRHLPIAVIDHDQSHISRLLTRNLVANPVTVPQAFSDITQAKLAMSEGKVYALVIYPDNMRKDLLTGKSPIIDVRYNSQFLLVGKLLSSQIQATLADGLKQVSMARQLLQGIPKAQAHINVSPIHHQVTALYNRNNDYDRFLLPGITVALAQIIAMLIFANGLTSELRHNTMKQWLEHGLARALWAKTLFYVPLLTLQFSATMMLVYALLGESVVGSMIALLPLQLMMIIAIWLIVLAIFWLLQESARVVSFGAALFAPAFPYLGVTFPVHDMPLAAQLWRLLMPSSHYIDSHLGLLVYQQHYGAIISDMSSYWVFALFAVIAILVSRKKAAQVMQ
ncbi:ABC transporter permease [Paraferrimonas haliotis]|uniref:ABC transporter n=1 Tax=Paraferrimonas haliotis TaxID=2013866 RepID=A0AA37WZ74_9GAMM|nr:ABC transporter permease [Paraferrimonas haliotis]GLS83706.1 ABC transporter [Paraferrimonas haliotis]